MLENTVLEGPDCWSSGASSSTEVGSSASCTGLGPGESGSYAGDLGI